MLLPCCSEQGSSASSHLCYFHAPPGLKPTSSTSHCSIPLLAALGHSSRLALMAESCFLKAALLSQHLTSHPAKEGAFPLRYPACRRSVGMLERSGGLALVAPWRMSCAQWASSPRGDISAINITALSQSVPVVCNEQQETGG